MQAISEKDYINFKRDFKKNSYKLLYDWCVENKVTLQRNQTVFFINERVLMKPEFTINNKIYIDLIEYKEYTDKYAEYCRLFSISFGTIIVIPRRILLEINKVTKNDIEQKNNFRF